MFLNGLGRIDSALFTFSAGNDVPQISVIFGLDFISRSAAAF